MEVYECIRSRRTVRNFKPDPIPEPLVRRILQGVRRSPSSSHSQPWQLVVVKDRDTLTELGRIASQGTFIAQAPLAIVFLMDNAPRPQLDAGRAIQQMELTAWAEGVGTCFVGVRQEEQQREIKELLGIPAEMELITILPFGYRDETATREGRPRKALRDIVHGEKFGQSYRAG